MSFELPAPEPLVLRYVPVRLTYTEARHHLQALPEEVVLLNGIPCTAGDDIEIDNGDFLCARLLQEEDMEFGNDIAVNFRISRVATADDVSRSLGNQPRHGLGGYYVQDRPTHDLTPEGTPSEPTDYTDRAQGAWHTAPLKVYPSVLCHGLVTGPWDAMARLQTGGASIAKGFIFRGRQPHAAS